VSKDPVVTGKRSTGCPTSDIASGFSIDSAGVVVFEVPVIGGKLSTGCSMSDIVGRLTSSSGGVSVCEDPVLARNICISCTTSEASNGLSSDSTGVSVSDDPAVLGKCRTGCSVSVTSSGASWTSNPVTGTSLVQRDHFLLPLATACSRSGSPSSSPSSCARRWSCRLWLDTHSRYAYCLYPRRYRSARMGSRVYEVPTMRPPG
jgi:hypothetical protein